MKSQICTVKSTLCALSAAVIACSSVNALANPIAEAGSVIAIPKHPLRSVVDIQLEFVDITSSSGGQSFARPQIRNVSKHAVGVTIEANIRLTGKLNALISKKTFLVTEHSTIPANTQLSTDLLLPVTSCATVTVTVTPDKNVMDMDMRNNTKSVMLPCPK